MSVVFNSTLVFLSIWSLAEPILIALILSTLIGVGALIVAYREGAGDLIRLPLSALIYYFAFGVPIALIAYVTGYLMSVSRTAAVGSVLPAILTLIGGANIYVFGSDSKYKLVIGFCVTLFIVTLFYGVQRGALEREGGREARLINLSDQEFRLRSYREFRGLPGDFPSWIVSGEPK